MENRGKNKAFIIAAVKMILDKNYNINLKDIQEIDTSITISENIEILKNKYIIKISINDINNF